MQCRACLQLNCAEVVHMSSTTLNDGNTLYDYFNHCTQLQANSMDKLPNVLCTNCIEKLQVAYNFRQAALQSDEQLQKLALDKQQKIDEDDEELIEPLQQTEEFKTNDPLDLPTPYDIETISNKQLVKGVDFETSAVNKVLKDVSTNLKCSTKLICELCSSNYFTKAELIDHLFHEHLCEIICIKCPKVYEFPHELQIHETLVHGTESNVQCLRCNQLIARNVLARHFQKCHPFSYMKYFPRRNRSNNPRIYCEDCQHEFSTILELAKHIKNHKFDCPICMMSFKKHASYKAHIKRVHNQSLNSLKANIESSVDAEFKPKFDCSLCPSKFKLNRTYRLHMKNVHNQYVRHTRSERENEKNLYECEICNLLFKSRSARHIHSKRKHHSNSKKSTTINSTQVNQNNDVGAKESDKNSSDNKACNICRKKFKCKSSCIKHMNKMHSESINRSATLDKEVYIFECEFCHMGFKLRASMYMHRRRKHPEMLIEKPKKLTDDRVDVIATGNKAETIEFVACKYCYKLIAMDKWTSHETNHIYNQRRQGVYLCAYCPREYKYDSALKRHEKEAHHTKINSQPTECPICQKMFKQTYLKLHIRRYHNTERKHVCSKCGITFKSHLLLYNHKRLHMERRSFPCNLCEKKFIRTIDLTNHMRQHTGEEPYVCHLCDQNFKSKSKLTYHLQWHAGIQLQCNICDEKFDDDRELKIHSFKHTGMPYKCSVCDYGTAKRDVFRKHLLRKHEMHMTNEEYYAMYKEYTDRSSAAKCWKQQQFEVQLALEDL